MVYHGIRMLLLLAMLLDEPSQERVGLATDLSQPLLQVLKIKQPQNRHEVVLVVRTRQLQQLRNHGPKLLGLFQIRHVAVITVVPLPRDHPHDVVKRHVVEPRSEFHLGKVLGRVLGELVNQPRRLVPPDSGEAVDAVGGEDVEGGDAAKVTPVFAVNAGP